jgi:hypothetical protein
MDPTDTHSNVSSHSQQIVIEEEYFEPEKRIAPGIFYQFNSNYKTNLLIKRLSDDCFMENLNNLVSGDDRAIVDRRHVGLIINYSNTSQKHILDYATNMEFIYGIEYILKNYPNDTLDYNQECIIKNEAKKRNFTLKEKKYLGHLIQKYDNHSFSKDLIRFL